MAFTTLQPCEQYVDPVCLLLVKATPHFAQKQACLLRQDFVEAKSCSPPLKAVSYFRPACLETLKSTMALAHQLADFPNG